MPQYVFKCSVCDAIAELYRAMKDRANPVQCRECGEPMRQQLTLPSLIIDGTDPAFPTAAGKWVRDRMRRMDKEKKNMAEHGTYK